MNQLYIDNISDDFNLEFEPSSTENLIPSPLTTFYHAASLDEHLSRGSWILGYWCTHCFNECEHLPGQKQYCCKCVKLQHQKYKALQNRGLSKDIEPGVVKIFFNPCQLLQHLRIHRVQEICIHQLMLLPFPTGIGIEYFPHLKMISEALIDFMFLKNIHLVDWLWQNKIHKWWRMAKGDNPVANIIKKYPFEVQQIKQLLNSSTKINLDSKLDRVCMKRTRSHNSKYNSKKSNSSISNCNIHNKINTSSAAIDAIKAIKSFELLDLKKSLFPTMEHNNQDYCLKNSEINTYGDKFTKMTDFSLEGNCTDNHDFFNKQARTNKIIPKKICSIPSKSSKYISRINNSETFQKVTDNKSVLFCKNDKINMDSFHSLFKQREYSQKLSNITFNKAQFYKGCTTMQFLNYFSEILKENFSDIFSSDSCLASITNNQIERESSKFEENVDLRLCTSIKNILEQIFSKQDLEFFTLTNNEKGKNILLFSKNNYLGNNVEYKSRMLTSLYNVNKNEMKFKINHIERLSRKYSEKFHVSNDEILEGHKSLIRILENIAKNTELPMQSGEDYFGLSCSTTSNSTCPTCHQVIRTPGYLIGFSEPLSEVNYCLCNDFICFECNQFQGNKKRFYYHLKYHQSEFPYTCPECELDFPSSKNLEVHMWTQCFHQFSKRFLFCTICDIGGFCSVEAIVNHFIVMHSMKMAVCSLCCIAFEYKRYRTSHMKKGHPEVKNWNDPLQLILCQLDDRIMSIESYNDHVMSHKCIQEITFYYCNLCLDTPRKLKTLESIKTHIYEYHLAELSNIISENSLKVILSMKDIQPFLKKQVKNNSCTEHGGGLNDLITSITTRTFKENSFDDHSKKKYYALKTYENRLSIFENNTLLSNFFSDVTSSKEQSVNFSNNSARCSSSIQATYNKQCDRFSIQNNHNLEAFKFHEPFINYTSESIVYTQENSLVQTPKNNTVNSAITERNQNLIRTDSIFTETNQKNKKRTNDSFELLDLSTEDISDNATLKFVKDKKIINKNIHQSCDLCKNTESDYRYSTDSSPSTDNEEIYGMNVLKNSPSYNTSAQNVAIHNSIETATRNKIAYVYHSHVRKDIIRDINKQLGETCLNPFSSVSHTTKSNVYCNINHNEEQVVNSSKLDGLHQKCEINILPNKDFELHFQSQNENEKTHSLKDENAADNDLNSNSGVIKQNPLENILTNIAKVSTRLYTSNNYTLEENISINKNKKFECDIINDASNNVDSHIIDLKKGEDCHTTMIFSEENIKRTRNKIIDNFSVRVRISGRITNLNQKFSNDDMNSKYFNILEKNISSIDKKCNLKLSESQKTFVRVNNESSQFLQRKNNTCNFRTPHYISNLKNLFENPESYAIDHLDNGHKTETCGESISLSHLMNDFDVRNQCSKKNVENSFHNLKIIHENIHAKMEPSKDKRGTESKSRQETFLIKHEDSNSLPLLIKPFDSVTLNNLEKTAQLQNKINTVFKLTDTPNYHTKLDENNLLFMDKYDINISNDIEVHDIELKDLDSGNVLMQKKTYAKDDEPQDGLKISKSKNHSSKNKKEINLPTIDLKNLSLTDDEKINLSKTSSLKAHNLKLSVSDNSVMNSKNLRPRIINQLNSANKPILKKTKSSGVAFRKFVEKSNTTLKKQKLPMQQSKTRSRKVVKTKQIISKFNANIISQVTSLQGNTSNEKKLLVERLNQNKNLLVKKNLKNEWPHLAQNANIQSKNKKSNEKLLHSQISLSKSLKTASQTSLDKKYTASQLKVPNKNRIGFFSNDSNIIKPCEFKCHLCGDLINSTWYNLNNHYSTKHPENYEVCNVSVRLSRISRTNSNIQLNMRMNNKRKSIEVLNTGSKKRKRRNMKTSIDKANDITDRTSGLYVRPEPIVDDEGNFKCKKCGERCTNIMVLRRHIYTNHRISKKNLICLECGENFVVSPSLEMHLKAFHEIDDPIAYMSKYPDYVPDVVDSEMESEVTVANQCHVCMAVFKDISAVDKHLRVHGMAFLNKKRIEARKARLASSQKQTNIYNELSTALQLIDNKGNGEDFFLDAGTSNLVSQYTKVL